MTFFKFFPSVSCVKWVKTHCGSLYHKLRKLSIKKNRMFSKLVLKIDDRVSLQCHKHEITKKTFCFVQCRKGRDDEFVFSDPNVEDNKMNQSSLTSKTNPVARPEGHPHVRNLCIRTNQGNSIGRVGYRAWHNTCYFCIRKHRCSRHGVFHVITDSIQITFKQFLSESFRNRDPPRKKLYFF